MGKYTRRAVATLPLVIFLWYIIFGWAPLNFWLMMTGAQVILVALSLGLRDGFFRDEGFRLSDLWLGVGSAAVLYGVFWLGDWLSGLIMPSSAQQIDAIYALKEQGGALTLGLLMLFIIGPAEEIYWRGFLQRSLGESWGRARAFWLVSLVYAGVHVVSGNLMLVVAAATAGFFWGWMYLRYGRLLPNIISHALWDVAVFVLFPIQ